MSLCSWRRFRVVLIGEFFFLAVCFPKRETKPCITGRVVTKTQTLRPRKLWGLSFRDAHTESQYSSQEIINSLLQGENWDYRNEIEVPDRFRPIFHWYYVCVDGEYDYLISYQIFRICYLIVLLGQFTTKAINLDRSTVFSSGQHVDKRYVMT